LITAIAVRRRLFRTFMSLPPPVLRLLSGGAGVHQGGRTLDPRIQYLNSLSGGEASAGMGLPDPDPAVARERLAIETPGGQASITVLRPPRQDADLPVLVFAPVGGGVASHADACEALCAMIARAARCVVLCVDPPAAEPALLDDTVTRLAAVYRWARQNAARFGAPADDAALGGAALGAVATVRITHELKAAGEPQPAMQFLLSPDFTAAQAKDARIAAAVTADLSGLAPAVIATTGFDPAFEIAEAYARSLRAAGISCHFRRYDSLTEGFVAFTGVVPAAARAAREIVGLTAHALQSRYVPADTAVGVMIGSAAETPVIVDRREAFN
jgi:acetyl esterase/lipase